jgi:tetratricopeptide (TPR) repeat protein
VSVQLLRTDGGDVLWSESFNEPSPSATEGRFARAPYAARMIEAIVRSAHRADTAPTRSDEARRNYFHGLRELDALAWDKGDWIVAADYFERAIDLDPALKGALLQLTYAYGTRLGNQIRAAQALERVHHVLPRLLRIDPNATLSLAFVNHNLDLDYASAIANIEHAHKHGFANVAQMEFHKARVRDKQGWQDEAVGRMKAAIRAGLGSFEANGHYELASILAAAGRYDEALAAVDRSFQSADPQWSRGQILRIRIGHYMGEREQAKRDLEHAWALFGEKERSTFPGVLAPLGQPDLARAILHENDLAWQAGRFHLCSYSFGGHYYLGEFDQAFVWLDRAIENREGWMLPFLRSKLFYADIRDDPRFQRAMRRLAEIEAMGSPTRSIATGLGAAG